MQVSLSACAVELPHGLQRGVAKKLGVTESVVSRAVTGDLRPKTERAWRTLRRIQVAIARARGLPVDVCFPPAAQTQQEASPVMAGAS